MDFAMARSVMVILLIIFYIKGCVCEPYFIIKRMHQSNCLRKTYQKKKKSKAFDTSTYLSLPGHLTLAVVGDIGEDNKVWSLTPTFCCPCQLSYISPTFLQPPSTSVWSLLFLVVGLGLKYVCCISSFASWSIILWFLLLDGLIPSTHLFFSSLSSSLSSATTLSGSELITFWMDAVLHQYLVKSQKIDKNQKRTKI